MIEEDPVVWWVCKRKRAFRSQHDALVRLHRDDTLNVYPCPYGDHWHVGHAPHGHVRPARLRQRARRRLGGSA